MLALVAGELLLRTCAPVRYRRPEGANEAHRSRWIHRASAVPGLSYELVPGADRSDLGYRVRVNALGLRGPPTTLAKPDGVLRVAVVGDSVTFGVGVSDEETWPAVLGRTLGPVLATEGLRCEVLNFGVTGYSSQDEARLIEGRVLAFAPDLVVVGYYLNDPEHEPLQELHRQFHTPIWWEGSHLLRLASLRLRLWELHELGGGDLFRLMHLERRSNWRSVLAAFDDIARATGARGVPVLLVVLPTFLGHADPAAPPRAEPGAIRFSTAWSDWAGYPYRALHAQVAAAAERAGLDAFCALEAVSGAGFEPGALRYDADHPNAVGHRLIGRAVARRILAERVALLGR